MPPAVKEGCGPLTPRQTEIYNFLELRILKGLPPTVREIGAEFGIRSPNGVMCHLKALEKKGLINRDELLSRAIELVYNPHDILKEKCRNLVKLHNAGQDYEDVIDAIDQLVSLSSNGK